MCRALKVLCAATDRRRLGKLKRGALSAQWELVGGALSVEELAEQVELHLPDVLVVDGALGSGAVRAARRGPRAVRLVAVGSLPGADAEVSSPGDIHEAVLGAPPPGGPIAR